MVKVLCFAALLQVLIVNGLVGAEKVVRDRGTTALTDGAWINERWN
jgi:hypothetical protein